MLLQRKFHGGRLIGVKLLHAGPRQNFSVPMVRQAQDEGWLRFRGHQLLLTTERGDVSYRILRTPGRYHLGAGVTEIINHYECVRED